MTQTRVSVVIAVYNGGADLEKCLAAIRGSSYPVFECILVDDASTDGMVDLAAERFDARVIRLDRQGGPARARNLGASEAEGEIIFFTDADVLLHEDAIKLAVDAFQSDKDISAIIGSYDDQPAHSAFISQYRNLFHHWVHQTGAESASTFWTGCGAIRRKVFEEMGGFSESYRKPSIEDIELGMRMRQTGHHIRLLKDMRGKHLKHWKFFNTIHTDIFMRGVPWMLLLLKAGSATNDLNLNYKSRAATVLAALWALLLLLLVLTGHAAALLPTAGFLLAATINAKLAVTENQRQIQKLITPALAAILPLACYWFMPDSLAWIPLVLLLALAATHFAFYEFVAQKRSLMFAIGVIPMQLVFFLGCALAIPVAYIQHHLGSTRQTKDHCSPESRQ